MTYWEGQQEKLSKRRALVHDNLNNIETMPINSKSRPISSPGCPPDYASYLIDVTIWILRSIALETGLVNEFELERAFHSFGQYIVAVFRYSKISYSVLFAALLYLLRFRQARSCAYKSYNDAIILPTLPVIFVASLIIANKFLHDQHCSNAIWTCFSGISLNDLNRGEVYFLEALDHRLLIEPGSFQRWILLLFQPQNLMPFATTATTAYSVIKRERTRERTDGILEKRLPPPSYVKLYNNDRPPIRTNRGQCPDTQFEGRPAVTFQLV